MPISADDASAFALQKELGLPLSVDEVPDEFESPPVHRVVPAAKARPLQVDARNSVFDMGGVKVTHAASDDAGLSEEARQLERLVGQLNRRYTVVDPHRKPQLIVDEARELQLAMQRALTVPPS